MRVRVPGLGGRAGNLAAVVARSSTGRTVRRHRHGVVGRWGASLIAFALAAATLLMIPPPAGGAATATVAMGSANDFAVLGASTVTNTGVTSIDGNVGLSPGTSVTGFPPGVLVPPHTIEINTASALQAQADLALAYTDAAGRAMDTTTLAEIGGQTLTAGVIGTPTRGALTLTGTLTLDGAGDPSSVFIVQTDTTLTTATNSAVLLVNGAQECNVFWQIGSSATLGTGTNFAGNILASASITVNAGATVRGRALAHGAAVTLDTDTFTTPTCDLAPPVTTTLAPVTTTTVAPTTTTTSAPTTTTTTATQTTPAATTTTAAPWHDDHHNRGSLERSGGDHHDHRCSGAHELRVRRSPLPAPHRTAAHRWCTAASGGRVPVAAARVLRALHRRRAGARPRRTQAQPHRHSRSLRVSRRGFPPEAVSGGGCAPARRTRRPAGSARPRARRRRPLRAAVAS